MANIFGIKRQVVTVAGIPLIKKGGLTPTEKSEIQELFEESKNKFNQRYLELVKEVKTICELETEAKAYGVVKRYFAGLLDDEDTVNKIELHVMQNPVKRQKDVDLEELTYLINSRLDRSTFPAADFKEAFGIEFDGTWTAAHTKAIDDLIPEIEKFFNQETEVELSESTPDEGKNTSD